MAQAKRWGFLAQEPRLAEILADPVVGLVMRSDGVSRQALTALIADAARRRRAMENAAEAA